jgi:hypothetical protein
MKPVVLVPTPDLLAVVVAGAVRAGRGPTVMVVSDDPAGAAVLDHGTEAELVLVPSEDRAWLTDLASRAVELGSRVIPALVVDVVVDPGYLTWLGGLPPELNIAVPALDDDDARHQLWASLHDSGAGERHHLVDVDGRPALDELAARGQAVVGERMGLLAAGAAGVLAGRMVVANRVWQRSIQA